MQLMDEIGMQIHSDISECEQRWRTFFKANCDALFQTALLLSADAVAAEKAVSESLDSLDLSIPPEHRNFPGWERAVVARSIETSQLRPTPPDAATRSMLQPGLLPVIQIERFPRVCFVLGMLLGYSTALCAQILGVEESHVRMLFQMAALQLQRNVVASMFQPEHVGLSVDQDEGTVTSSSNA